MTALVDDSCATAPERARLALAGRRAAPAPVLDVPGSHRAWVMVAFLLGTMARETPGAAQALSRDPSAGGVLSASSPGHLLFIWACLYRQRRR